MRHIGMSEQVILRLTAQGYLTQRLPRVYAIGHDAPSYLADLWEAILYAGPGAMLSHGTAAKWRGLINYAPRVIHVSTPRKVNSLPGIRVHNRRDLPREIVRGIPVTTVAQTMLDVAATMSKDVTRHALSQLDYDSAVSWQALNAIGGSGKPGTNELREALRLHDPNLAKLNDAAEVRLYELLVASDIRPLPEPNVRIEADVELDAYWPGLRLAAEVNGKGAHHSAAQQIKDADKALACDRLGIKLVWFAAVAVFHKPDQVLDSIATEVAVAKRRAA